MSTKLIFFALSAALLLAACGKSEKEIIQAQYDCLMKAKTREASDLCAKETGANEKEQRAAGDKVFATPTDFSKWNFPKPEDAKFSNYLNGKDK